MLKMLKLGMFVIICGINNYVYCINCATNEVDLENNVCSYSETSKAGLGYFDTVVFELRCKNPNYPLRNDWKWAIYSSGPDYTNCFNTGTGLSNGYNVACTNWSFNDIAVTFTLWCKKSSGTAEPTGNMF
jgi:hypothetical protein